MFVTSPNYGGHICEDVLIANGNMFQGTHRRSGNVDATDAELNAFIERQARRLESRKIGNDKNES